MKTYNWTNYTTRTPINAGFGSELGYSDSVKTVHAPPGAHVLLFIL